MIKGSHHSIKTRRKMSVAHKGKECLPATREKLRIIGKAKGGHSCSEETRRRISISKKGNPLSAEHIAKIVKANKGRRCSNETKAKISDTLMGHKISTETKRKIQKSLKGRPLAPEHKKAVLAVIRRGDTHHWWKGGIDCEPYTHEFTQQLRKDIRKRDDHKCQICGVPQIECKGRLAVHHVDYDKKNSDPVNLIALCHSCHTRTGANRKHWKIVLQALMIKKGWLLTRGDMAEIIEALP